MGLSDRIAQTVLSLACTAALALPITAVAQDADPTLLSVEELLEIRVYSASKFEQKMSEAPASVTVINAEEIRTYGYRTLGEILASVRGLFVTYDRNYSYLGVRGFERPGDYDARILLLVDGYRLNDTLYDTAGIGTEFPIDVDLIERIEVIRGPGSSIYGSNAFFGVVNVITRKGRDIGGLEAVLDLGSFDTQQQRLTGGRRDAEGFEWLLSGTRYSSGGQTLYYPEFDDPSTNHGLAENADGDRADRLFGKLAHGAWSATAAWSRREKQIPTASYETVFNDPRARTSEEVLFIDLGYRATLAGGWDFTPRLFFGSYDYKGAYPYDDGSGTIVLNFDRGIGQWWGSELKLDGQIGRHRLVGGVEYQHNYRQDQANFDAQPHAVYLDDRRSSQRVGVYVQDEVMLFARWHLSAGMRYDDYAAEGGDFNPRLGLVWEALPTVDLKLLYGTAFRAPNHYELFYSGDPNKANPDLGPEEIRTWELIGEWRPRANLRLTLDAYTNRISDLITQVTDQADDMLVFVNAGDTQGRGIEFEAEQALAGDLRWRASYAWQRSTDEATGATLSNSPRHLAKLNLSVPLPRRLLRAGAELRYMSERQTLSGGSVGSRVLANLMLTTAPLPGGFELSVGAYNLFDRDYADPGRPEHVQDLIPQDGRSLRARLTWRFTPRAP